MKKRIFSILLALCMVLTFMPTTAFALSTPPDFDEGWTKLTANYLAGEGIDYTLKGGDSASNAVHYVLSDDVVEINRTINVTGYVVLDLNGKVLKMNSSIYNGTATGSVIIIESTGNLTLQDSNPTAVHKFDTTNALWVLDETDGTETVYGGVITGGTGTEYFDSFYGGGVNIEDTVDKGTSTYKAGTFTMKGGNIVGCTADYGGGISSRHGEFTLLKGYIEGCTANNGGGAYVKEGNFNMQGGAIKYCKATSSANDGGGGGVYVFSGLYMSVFNMYGGEISNCASNKCGGGVFVSDGECVFNMTAGTIKNCAATSNGNGVYIRGSSEENQMQADGGVIEDSVYVNSDGKITCSETASGSTVFKGEVTNNGTISGGTFYGTVTNGGTISGGNFHDKVIDSYCIIAGTFFSEVMNEGSIQGGTFYGGIKGPGTKFGMEYTVSFDLNGGSGTAPVTQVFVNTNLAKAKKPDSTNNPTRDYYTFLGWYEKDDEGEFKEKSFEFETTTISKDIKLYAKWLPKNDYKVKFDTNGGNAMSEASINYDDPLSKLGIPTRDGYEFTAWKYNNTEISASETATKTYADLAGSDTVTSITLIAQWKDNQPPTFDGLKDGESYRGDVTFTVSDGNGSGIANVNVNVQSSGKSEILTADTDGKYTLKSGIGKVDVTATDEAGNSNTITVTVNSRSSSTIVQKPTLSFGDATDVKIETAADGSTVYTTAEGKLVLSKDGTTASITPADGYEVANVSVNGIDKGAVTTLTGLKTGDKIIVTFKQTAEAQSKAEIAQIKSLLGKMSLTARSSKTAKGNIKIVFKPDTKTQNYIQEMKDMGYTVKYRFYRSTKKSAGYKSMLTKTGKTYTNTNGKSGTRYYYKVQVRAYDENGKCVAKTALKQCKYATRIFG